MDASRLIPVGVSVVVCAFDLGRWEQTLQAVASIRAQTMPVREVIVVIDHNPELLARAQERWPGSYVRVCSSRGANGLSGARNTGVALAESEIVAFLDDDAAAEATWIERLVAPYADPLVVGCGGGVVPMLGAPRPTWWPLEFDWVIGCSYTGMPTVRSDVRNVIGANMSARRAAIVRVGGFAEGMGRIGARPLGCEETDLFIRLARALPGRRIVYEPSARVHHHVPPSRLRWAYFRDRCVAEGRSKAMVTARLGTGDGLATERFHVLRVLPAGMARGLRERAPLRSVAIAAGLGLTTAGYAAGRGSARFRP